MIDENGQEVASRIITIRVDAGTVYGLSDDGNIYLWSPIEVRWNLYKVNEIKQQTS